MTATPESELNVEAKLTQKVELALVLPFVKYAAASTNLMAQPEVRGPLSHKERKYTRQMKEARAEANKNVAALIQQVSDQRVREAGEDIKAWMTHTFEETGPPWNGNDTRIHYEATRDLLFAFIDQTLADYLSHKEARDE